MYLITYKTSVSSKNGRNCQILSNLGVLMDFDMMSNILWFASTPPSIASSITCYKQNIIQQGTVLVKVQNQNSLQRLDAPNLI